MIFDGTMKLSKGTIAVLVTIILAISIAITILIVTNNAQKFTINAVNSGVQAGTGINPDVVNSGGGALSSDGNSDWENVWDKSGDIYGDRGSNFFDNMK